MALLSGLWLLTLNQWQSIPTSPYCPAPSSPRKNPNTGARPAAADADTGHTRSRVRGPTCRPGVCALLLRTLNATHRKRLGPDMGRCPRCHGTERKRLFQKQWNESEEHSPPEETVKGGGSPRRLSQAVTAAWAGPAVTRGKGGALTAPGSGAACVMNGVSQVNPRPLPASHPVPALRSPLLSEPHFTFFTKKEVV